MIINELSHIEIVKCYLRDWSDWCRGYRVRTGWPNKSAVIETGGAVTDEDDSLSDDYSHLEKERCEIIDACIDDLQPIERAAIHHKYLHTVYRMRDYATTLEQAHNKLFAAFRKKGIYVSCKH